MTSEMFCKNSESRSSSGSTSIALGHVTPAVVAHKLEFPVTSRACPIRFWSRSRWAGAQFENAVGGFAESLFTRHRHGFDAVNGRFERRNFGSQSIGGRLIGRDSVGQRLDR